MPGTNTRITSILGNGQKLDGGAMFGNAPRAVWQKWIAPDEIGRIPLACRCLLAETMGKTVLFETGIGAFFDPKLADRYGVQDPQRHLLLENLNTLGVDEADVDYVILSHLHFDHAGGLLSAYSENEAPRLHFPNAQYVVGREAWDRALHPHPRDRASFIPELTELLQNSGRLKIIENPEPETLLDGRIEFFVSSGHTPGQMHAILHVDTSTIVFAGDLIPGRAWVHLPITMGYDRYPEMLIDEKQSLYERAVGENWLVFFTHDHEVAAATVHQDDRGRYQPRDTFVSLERYSL